MTSAKENSTGQTTMAQVLGAFSLATDLGTGQPMGNVIRACYTGMRIAQEMGLSSKEQGEIFYTCLLAHSGCTAGASDMAALLEGDEVAAQHFLLGYPSLPEMLGWIGRSVAPDAPIYARTWKILKVMGQGMKLLEERSNGVCEVAARIAERLGMPPEVQTGLRYLFEFWNGTGVFHMKGEAIPLHSRIAYAASALAIVHGDHGQAVAQESAKRQSGKSIDPNVAGTFLSVAQKPGFWEEVEQEGLWETVLAMEPDVPYKHLDESKLDDLALAFADFADLKLPRSFHHSRNVAAMAEGIARRLGLSFHDTVTIRRAALLHDMGLAAIPSLVLAKPSDKLDPTEKEKLMLHPYHAERILARVPALKEVAELAGAHHERMDGNGYYRRLSGNKIPEGARIIAVVDRFDDVAREGPNGERLEPDEALKRMKPEVGPALDPDCFQAFLQELGAKTPEKQPRRDWPAGLTDREVEVLRLAVRGMTKRQVAQRLVLSEKTVDHHLEHIYTKINVSTRAAATLFAVENDLLS